MVIEHLTWVCSLVLVMLIMGENEYGCFIKEVNAVFMVVFWVDWVGYIVQVARDRCFWLLFCFYDEVVVVELVVVVFDCCFYF